MRSSLSIPTSSRTPASCTRTWAPPWLSWRPSSRGTRRSRRPTPASLALAGRRARPRPRHEVLDRLPAADPPDPGSSAAFGRRRRRVARPLRIGLRRSRESAPAPWSSSSRSTLRSRPAWTGATSGRSSTRWSPCGGLRVSRARSRALPASRRPIGQYLGGLASVARQNAVGGGVNFLNGKVSVTGFPSYFFVAFALKSTLAFLAVDRSSPRGARPGSGPRVGRPRSGSCLSACSFSLRSGRATTSASGTCLPVYPFLALAGAGLLARLGSQPAGASRALVLLGPAARVARGDGARSTRTSSPTSTPLAGGPLGGRKILSDSNVDWGLDSEAPRGGAQAPRRRRPDRRLFRRRRRPGTGRRGRLRGGADRAGAPGRHLRVRGSRRTRVLCVSWRPDVAGALARARSGTSRHAGGPPAASVTRSISSSCPRRQKLAREAVCRHARLQRGPDDPRDRPARLRRPDREGDPDRRRRLDRRHARHPAGAGRQGRRARLPAAPQPGQGRGRRRSASATPPATS